MSLWGTSSTNRTKPKFLVAGGRYSPDDCYATDQGWVLRRKDGTTELLVCVTGLATALGNAEISGVQFEKKLFQPDDVAKVFVSWTEPVTLSSGTPILSVTTVSGVGSPITFMYVSGSGTNEFTFTATLTAATYSGEVLAIAGQSFGASASFAGSADTTFINGDRLAAPGQGVYANPDIAGALIDRVAFTAATLSAAADTCSVKVRWNRAVVVTGVPTLVVAQTVSGNHTLNYASGSGTDTLIFTGAFDLVSTRVVSVVGQTLGVAGGATVKGLGTDADIIFVNGDRRASDFTAEYADITVGA